MNIYEIGTKIQIYENRLLFIKRDLQKELNRMEINWKNVYELSTKSLDYTNKIKYNFSLKLECIKESV